MRPFSRLRAQIVGRRPGPSTRQRPLKRTPAPRVRPRLEAMEDRLCPSTVLDVGILSLPSLLLDGTTTVATSSVQDLDLTVGSHILTSTASGLGGAVSFSVDSVGDVSYDPSLEGILSGAGTSALAVNGATVTIDPSAALTLPAGLLLNEAGPAHAVGTPFSATLLPGQSYLQSAASGLGGAVSFIIDSAGHIVYDPALEGVLSGAGTAALAVNGATVTIDPSAALTLPAGLLLNEAGPAHAVGTPFSATLLPGQSYLQSAASGLGGAVSFIIDSAGYVGYDPALEGVLSQAGTTTLTVNGATVTIDAQALTLPSLVLNFGTDFATAKPFAARILPGEQLLQPSVDGLTLLFSVGDNGAVDYDPSLDGALSGRGGATLMVKGHTTTAVTSSLSTSAFGQSVTFTAAVAALAPGAPTPTGTVALWAGTMLLGTGTLDSTGQATLTTTALAPGTGTITVVYSGDARYLASTSTVLSQTVLSAQDELQLTIERVRALVATGVINSGNGNALIVKLSNAIASLDSGNTSAGVGQMDAFLNQVSALRKALTLDSTDAQTLTGDVDAAIVAALAVAIE